MRRIVLDTWAYVRPFRYVGLFSLLLIVTPSRTWAQAPARSFQADLSDGIHLMNSNCSDSTAATFAGRRAALQKLRAAEHEAVSTAERKQIYGALVTIYGCLTSSRDSVNYSSMYTSLAWRYSYSLYLLDPSDPESAMQFAQRLGPRERLTVLSGALAAHPRAEALLNEKSRAAFVLTRSEQDRAVIVAALRASTVSDVRTTLEGLGDELRDEGCTLGATELLEKLVKLQSRDEGVQPLACDSTKDAEKKQICSLIPRVMAAVSCVSK